MVAALFSGKDPTKVGPQRRLYGPIRCQEPGGGGIADRLEFQISYVIGRAEPLSVSVEDF